jgi:hypothetical protein
MLPVMLQRLSRSELRTVVNQNADSRVGVEVLAGLQLSASLAAGAPLSLCDTVTGIDDHNTALLALSATQPANDQRTAEIDSRTDSSQLPISHLAPSRKFGRALA